MKIICVDNRLTPGRDDWHEGKKLTLGCLVVGKEYEAEQSPGNPDQWLIGGIPYGKDRFDLTDEALFGGK